MIKPPEHPLGFAFEKAREWELEQQPKLTEKQKRLFAELVNSQALERRKAQERLDAFRTQLREWAKKRKPKPELALKPPIHVPDPNIRRQARAAIAAEKRLERLDRQHTATRIRTLQEFEGERAGKPEKTAKSLANAWSEALKRTASQERDRDQAKDLDKSR